MLLLVTSEMRTCILGLISVNQKLVIFPFRNSLTSSCGWVVSWKQERSHTPGGKNIHPYLWLPGDPYATDRYIKLQTTTSENSKESQEH